MSPPAAMASTNKWLAQSNKSATAKANKRQDNPYRERRFRAPGQVSQRAIWVEHRARRASHPHHLFAYPNASSLLRQCRLVDLSSAGGTNTGAIPRHTNWRLNYETPLYAENPGLK